MGVGFKTKKGGGLFRGRLTVTTCRCVIGKPEKATQPPSTQVVVKGRDAAGGKQELWLSLGGDAKAVMKRFKPSPDGKDIVALAKDDAPSDSSKWGLFAASLGGEKFNIGKQTFEGVGFPEKRLAEMALAALDGCTLEIDNYPMDVGAAILLDIQRKGKSAPAAYIVTGFELPGGGPASDDTDDDEEEDEDEGSDEDADDGAELSAIGRCRDAVQKALAKAGKPVELKLLREHIAKKFAEDEDVDEMVAALTAPAAWTTLAGWSLVVDRKAKTVAAD